MTLAVVLMGVGLLLIIVEVLVPSFGLLVGLATLAIVGSIFLAWQEDPALGASFLLAAVVLVPVVVLVGFKVLPNTPLGRHLILSGPSFSDVAAVDQRDKGLEGQEGVALTPLRPAGMARIAGRRVDVVSRGERIEEGAHVRVLEVRGNRVVVTRSREEAPDSGPAAGPAATAGSGPASSTGPGPESSAGPVPESSTGQGPGSSAGEEPESSAGRGPVQ